jgi:TatD DNase family protein
MSNFMTHFVDTHCHIDLCPAPGEVIKGCEEENIYTIAVTNLPSVFEHTATLTEATKFVRASVGLHPQLVRSHAREIDLIQPLLQRTRYVGEIGIDYSEPDRNDHAHQRRIFGRILVRVLRRSRR